MLQRPGPWSGVAWIGRDDEDPFDLGRSDLRRFELTIPDADEHSFELELDTLPRLRSREELER